MPPTNHPESNTTGIQALAIHTTDGELDQRTKNVYEEVDSDQEDSMEDKDMVDGEQSEDEHKEPEPFQQVQDALGFEALARSAFKSRKTRTLSSTEAHAMSSILSATACPV